MSDHIAHIAICDDSFRLAAVHPKLHPWLKSLMPDHREVAHLGSVTRSADTWSVGLLQWACDQQKQDAADRDAHLDEKIAFVLGSLTHRAADRLTKPITNIWKGRPDAGESGGDANESKIMQDLCVLREVFGHGEGDHAAQFPKALFHVLDHAQGRPLEAAFQALLTRALIAMHTIKPDADNIHPWLTHLFEARQTYPKSLAQYNTLNEAWEPAKVKKYLTDMRFYDRDDALIRLARDAQHGKPITGEQVVEAHQATPFDAPDASRYARALSRALDYLLAAGDIIEGELTTEQARTALDIGVPELSLSHGCSPSLGHYAACLVFFCQKLSHWLQWWRQTRAAMRLALATRHRGLFLRRRVLRVLQKPSI